MMVDGVNLGLRIRRGLLGWLGGWDGRRGFGGLLLVEMIARFGFMRLR